VQRELFYEPGTCILLGVQKLLSRRTKSVGVCIMLLQLHKICCEREKIVPPGKFLFLEDLPAQKTVLLGPDIFKWTVTSLLMYQDKVSFT
jgi:hypothetical protein